METHVLKTLIVPQIIRIFSAIYETRISLLYSKNPPLVPIPSQKNPEQTLSSYLLKSQLKIITTFRDAQISQISRSHLKILCARKMTRSKFHAEDPYILGCTGQNLFARDLCYPHCELYLMFRLMTTTPFHYRKCGSNFFNAYILFRRSRVLTAALNCA